MDFHVLGQKGDRHIMTTHRGEVDETPLQLISGARLAYYNALEQALKTFVESVAVLLPAPPQQVESASGDVDDGGKTPLE